MRFDRLFLRQLVLYGIIGGCSALLDIAVFSLLYSSLSVNEFIANIISIHLGITVSFLLNRKYNFKKTDRILFRAVSFYLTGLFGLALSEGLLWLGNMLLLAVLLVKVASVFFVAAVQFIINRYVAFGSKADNISSKTQ